MEIFDKAMLLIVYLPTSGLHYYFTVLGINWVLSLQQIYVNMNIYEVQSTLYS